MDQLDSLEDWVAIKEHPFLDDPSQRPKLKFKVTWNDAERKVLIECTKPHRAKDGLSVRTASFTPGELNAVHNQLSLVHPRLGPYVPALPEEPRGLWSYISPSTLPIDSVQICDEVRSYLSAAFDICGEHLLVDTLFEECSMDEYFEKISELRRRSYDEALRRTEEDLQKVLLLRAGSINMLDMVEVYKLEDEVMFRWNVALAELYNYLIQPFLDVRAPAMEKLMEARKGLQEPQCGEMTQEDYVAMLSEWQKTYIHALDSIQELYIEYYNRTVALLTDAQDRMLTDKNKFGKKSFEVLAKERFIRVSEDVSAEKIQLLQNTKKHYENQRDKIKQEIASLDDQPGLTEKEIAALERKTYEWQVKIYDSHLDVLQEEEKLIRLKMNIIKQEIAAKEDEITFFDAVENLDDLDEAEDEFTCGSRKTLDPRLKQLDCKVAAICRKKATIRNKKKALIEAKNLKVQKKQNEEKKIRNHHNIQLKRDDNQAELQKKQEFIEEERRKTVERLKQYRMKYATPSTIRPPRRQPQSQKQGLGKPRSLKPTNKSDATDRKSGAAVHPETGISRKENSEDSTDTGNLAVLENHEPQSLLVIPVPSQPPPAVPPPPPSCVPPPPPPPPPAPLLSMMPPNCALPPIPSAACNGKRSGDGQKLNGTGGASSGLSVDIKTIQDAKGRLKKTDLPSDKPVVMPFVSMMQLIKQKEKLRPVKPSNDTADGGQAQLRTPSSDDHIKHLQEALERINRFTRQDEDSDNTDEDFADFSN